MIKPDMTINCQGLACPMPIVRARKAMGELEVGQILEIIATDRGAPADFKAWAQQTENRLVSVQEQDGRFHLYLKKLVPEVKEKGRQFEHEISNNELTERLQRDEPHLVLDVREIEEYQAGHIPGALHIPVDRLDQAAAELDRNQEIFVICRSGRRSDYACQILAQKGFNSVVNVVPGMSEWQEPMEKTI